MCSTVVRRRSSAAMPLRLSNSTPMVSRPRFSTVGPRPTDTSIRSHSTVSPSPKWTVRPLPESSTFVHCFSRCSTIPRLPNCFASSLEVSGSLDPLHPVGLEEAGDARGHLIDDLRLPFVGGPEVEAWRADLDAELGERVLGLLDRERGLHPSLRRDAADAQAGAPELRLLLDADRLGAELRGADRRGVAAGASAENCDVRFHLPDPT